MGMYASSEFYEQGFNVIKTNSRYIIITTGESASMATAIDRALAWTTGAASTDFVVTANTSGYILTIDGNGDLISASALETTGVASHICVGTTATLYYVTTCTTKALGSGDTVTMPTWNIWIKGPTS